MRISLGSRCKYPLPAVPSFRGPCKPWVDGSLSASLLLVGFSLEGGKKICNACFFSTVTAYTPPSIVGEKTLWLVA